MSSIEEGFMKICVFLVSFVLFFLSLSVNAKGNFITLSDIHFDPYASCIKTQKDCPVLNKLIDADVSEWATIFENMGTNGISHYGQDTSNALLESTLSELVKRYDKYPPKFVIINGDFLSHNFQQAFQYFAPGKSYNLFVAKTFSYLSLRIAKAFPNSQILPVVGNNDAFGGDYYSSPQGDFYKSLLSSNVWGPFFKGIDKVQFLQGGYYKVSPSGEPNHLIIVLNSVLFSAKAKGPSSDAISAAATRQLHWLADTLSKAKEAHQKVWLVFHIPFGVDVYDSKATHHPVMFWSTAPVNFNKLFLDIISSYDGVIQAMITSHTHDDELMVYHNMLDVFAPSISPTHYNNPAFKEFSYDDSFTLINNETYYLNLQDSNPRWQFEYDFDKAYGNAHSMRKATLNLLSSKGAAYVEKYEKYFDALGADPINSDDWSYYRCGIFYHEADDYQRCALGADQ